MRCEITIEMLQAGKVRGDARYRVFLVSLCVFWSMASCSGKIAPDRGIDLTSDASTERSASRGPKHESMDAGEGVAKAEDAATEVESGVDAARAMPPEDAAIDASIGHDGGVEQDAATATPDAFEIEIEASATSGTAPLPVHLSAKITGLSPDKVQSYAWTVDDQAVGSNESVDVTLSKLGCHAIEVVARSSDGTMRTAQTRVSLNSGDLTGTASIDARPRDHAIVPREPKTNTGALEIAGSVARGGYAEIVATLRAGTSVRSRVAFPLCDDATDKYSMTIPVPVELTSFDLSIELVRGQDAKEVGRISDVLAGDALIINGQSNAVAGRIAADHDPTLDEGMSNFIRTFSWSETDETAKGWFVGVGTEGYELNAHVGQWALRMASLISAQHKLPIAIINGGEGGKTVDYFFRDDASPANFASNYGQLLVRVRESGFGENVRALIWYQGEADPGRASWADDYQRIRAGWAKDFPSIERFYITQVHTGCTGDLLTVQEMQRTLPDNLERTGLMSTNGLDAHDGCHFYYVGGYRTIGDRYAALVERDLYGVAKEHVESPNPLDARLAPDGRSITLRMRDSSAQLVFQAGAEANFEVSSNGSSIAVTGGVGNGSSLTLSLGAAAQTPATVSYRAHEGAGPWVIEQNSGIGLLVFSALPVIQ